MASHNSNLLLPNCNNLALSLCSPRSPCLQHTCAHSCLSCPKAPVRCFSTLPLAWWEAACATPGSQIWEAEGRMRRQQLSPTVCILTASVVPRTHRHLESCRVTGGRETDRQGTHYLFSVSIHSWDCTYLKCCWSGFSCTDLPQAKASPGLNSFSLWFSVKWSKNKLKKNKKLNRGLECNSVS